MFSGVTPFGYITTAVALYLVVLRIY